MPWLRMQFVDGARMWHRLWSVRFSILATISSLAGVLSYLLPMFQDMMHPIAFGLLSLTCAVAAGVSSLVKQPRLLADIQAKQGGSDA